MKEECELFAKDREAIVDHLTEYNAGCEANGDPDLSFSLMFPVPGLFGATQDMLEKKTEALRPMLYFVRVNPNPLSISLTLK